MKRCSPTLSFVVAYSAINFATANNFCPTTSVSWQVFNGICYYNAGSSDYPTCKQICANLDASMLCVDDVQANDYIYQSLMSTSGTSNEKIWVGYTDNSAEGVWEWDINSCGSTYGNWRDGKPENNSTRNCAISKSYQAGQWEDKECERNDVDCGCQQLAENSPTLSPVAILHSCPFGWDEFNSVCYKSFETGFDYPSCQTQCYAEGATMLCIEDEASNLFIRNSLVTTRDLWIGLNDELAEGQWVWDVAGCTSTYTNWQDNAPSRGAYDCAIMMENDPWWNEARCTADDNFHCGCQIKLAQPPTYSPSRGPTIKPSAKPTISMSPSYVPTVAPSTVLTAVLTSNHTIAPTALPTTVPSTSIIMAPTTGAIPIEYGTNCISENEYLLPGQQCLISLNGNVEGCFKSNGDFCLTNLLTQVEYWCANVHSSFPGKFVMQGDGNLVMYQNSSGGGDSYYQSNTMNAAGQNGAFAVLQSNQNFVVYSSDMVPLFACNVAQPPCPLDYSCGGMSCDEQQCYKSNHSVVPASAPTAATLLPPLSCPDGQWIERNGTCYFPFSQTVDYSTCNSLCAELNASMLCVENEQSDTWLASQLQVGAMWLGYYYIAADESYHWPPSCTSTYTSWPPARRQLLSSPSQCVVMDSSSGGYWVSEDCTSLHTCTCQHPAPATVIHAPAPSPVPSVSPSKCPRDGTLHDGTCFFTPVDGLLVDSYSTCSNVCASVNASMLCIRDSLTNDLLTSILSSYGSFWLGLRGSGSFEWESGCTSTYTQWAGGEPPSNPYESCAVLDAFGGVGSWSAGQCDISLNCLCQAQVGTIIPAPTATPTVIKPQDPAYVHTCPDSWELHDDRCYKSTNPQLSFAECTSACQSVGAEIICVSDIETNDWLHSTIMTSDMMWLAYSRYGSLTEWAWAAFCPHPNSSFENWATGYLDGYGGNANCAVMLQGVSGQWDDTSCDQLCECGCEQAASLVLSNTARPPTATPSQSPSASTATPIVNPTSQPSIWTPCMDGWLLYDGVCYRNVAASTDFSTCKSYCQNAGASMLCVPDSNTNSWLAENIVHSTTSMWLGFTYNAQEGTFEWTDTSCTSAYANWRVGEPNGGADFNCVVFSDPNFEWLNKSCNVAVYDCGCQMPATELLTTVPSAAPSTSTPSVQPSSQPSSSPTSFPSRTARPSVDSYCPAGWYKNGDNCYKKMSGIYSYNACKNKCEDKDASMLCIEDLATSNWIYESFVHSSRDMWIGLDDKANELDFVWQPDCSSTISPPWTPGEPDTGFLGGPIANCVYISNDDGTWNDYDCLYPAACGCQQPHAKFVPTSTPTKVPTTTPSSLPSVVPTSSPTVVPTRIPTEVPTDVPTEVPTSSTHGSAHESTHGSAHGSTHGSAHRSTDGSAN